MTADQFIQWIEEHLADQQQATSELDELVHDAKAGEAADINNAGIESQLRYLLDDGSAALSRSTIEEYCQRLELPLPAEAVQEADDDEPSLQFCACDNCSWNGSVEDAEPIRDLWQRVDPNGTIPIGECPVCGALAYLEEEGRNDGS